MGVKIYERFPGQWWIWVNHKNQRCAKPVGCYEAALETKRIFEEQIATGIFQFPAKREKKEKEVPKPTVREYFRTFGENHLALQRESTRQNYVSTMDNHILDTIGDLRLDQVALEHIVRIVVKMRSITHKDGSPKLSRGTIDRAMRELRTFFNHAIEHKVIEESPVPRPQKPNPMFKAAPTRREEVDPLGEDEVPLFFTALRKDLHSRKHVTLFLTLIHTGLRIGETLALEWPDVDWHKRELIIRRTWDRDFKVLRPPKNDKVRRVPISDELFEALQAYRTAKIQEWFKHNSHDKRSLVAKRLWNATEHLPRPVFHSRNGGCLNADNLLRRHLKGNLRTARIREHAMHDLRYTFASLHLSNGTPNAYVSEWMGHSTIELTVKLYGHLQPKQGHDYINSLPGLESKNLQQTCNKPENSLSDAPAAVISFPVSGNDCKNLNGAGDGDRTRDVQLGKLAFYR
jgi:integrase